MKNYSKTNSVALKPNKLNTATDELFREGMDTAHELLVFLNYAVNSYSLDIKFADRNPKSLEMECFETADVAEMMEKQFLPYTEEHRMAKLVEFFQNEKNALRWLGESCMVSNVMKKKACLEQVDIYSKKLLLIDQ